VRMMNVSRFTESPAVAGKTDFTFFYKS